MSIQYIEVDGKTMEFLDYKNDKIKGELEDILQDFLKEQLLDKSGRKKFGFRILCQIEDCLGKYGRMSADEFVNLTADDIDDLWWHFHSLMA